MSEQYWGCLDKMSEVNFSPAETLLLRRLTHIPVRFCTKFPEVVSQIFSVLSRSDPEAINLPSLENLQHITIPS